MFVKDVMTPSPITVTPDTLVIDAEKTMRENKIRALPVMKGDKLVGIVTINTLREAMPSKVTTLSQHEIQYLLLKLKVEDVMTRNPITVNENALLEEAAILMNKYRIGHLPVLNDQKKLVGIITETDIFKTMIKILGLEEEGIRLTIEDVPVEAGKIADIVCTISQFNPLILSLTTLMSPDKKKRTIVMRIKVANPDNVFATLRDKGYKIYVKY